MTKRSTPSTPQVPPPDVPLDQTIALFDWEGRPPPPEGGTKPPGYKLFQFLRRHSLRKVRRAR